MNDLKKEEEGDVNVKTNEDTNPPIVLEDIENRNGRKLKVIRDDLLIGGTKQRALIAYLSSRSSIDEFVYAGPVFGYAQIALGYASKLTGKKGTLFLESKDPLHPLTQKAKSFGAKVIQVGSRATLKQVQEESQNYVEREKREGRHIELLPFGLHDEEFINLLVKSIREAVEKGSPELLREETTPKRMWLVVGSGTIMEALHRIWPQTHLLLVQVGKRVWPDQVEHIKHTLYVAPEKFWEISKRLPPYPSVSTYDAKLWQFVEDHGESGDFIWNVGKDVDPVESEGSNRDRVIERRENWGRNYNEYRGNNYRRDDRYDRDSRDYHRNQSHRYYGEEKSYKRRENEFRGDREDQKRYHT
eukprot:TRINITY_DN3823_c0_g1_i1.p1 TRINITY_DN3823_c0_g1~~TRINITY_DN3823_c0_g1_i1.p1  ORF type:complete len:358 (-),score=121.47 TRINITY_DN3823_c0_g1_i1:806-1879(-)